MTRQCKECRAKTIEDLRKAIRSVVSDMQISNEQLERENNLFKKISTFLTDNQLFSLRELEQENKKLKDEIGYLQQVLLQIKDIAMCGGDCEQDCDHCMQGQIHQLIKETLNGRKD